MSIWSIFSESADPELAAPPVPISEFTKADSDSLRPFAAECITGVHTFRGVKHDFHKPMGIYALVDREALEQRRLAKAKLFEAMVSASVETELFFDQTFSREEWSTKHNTKTLMGVGT